MTSERVISDSSNKVDQVRLEDFMGKIVNDLGATWSTVLVIIGDKLGLYKAMADSKPVTAAELASRTRTTERYTKEWLANQAASGYIIYDSNTGKYTLPPEQAMALANENSPVFSLGGFQAAMAFFRDEPKPWIHQFLAEMKQMFGDLMINLTLNNMIDGQMLKRSMGKYQLKKVSVFI